MQRAPSANPPATATAAAATSTTRFLAFAAWAPVFLIAVCLAAVALSAQPSGPVPGLPRRTPTVVLALNLLLLTGNALALTWYLAMFTWARLRGEAGAAFARLMPGAAVGVGLGGVVATSLAAYAGGDMHVAMALFIYAPTLLFCYGLLGLAASRMRSWWIVALAGTGLAVLLLGSQSLYLNPGGREPSEALFTLSGLPLLAALGIWLVTWTAAPERPADLPVA